MHKQIIVLIIFGMFNFCVLNDVISGEKNSGNNDFNGDEIEEMLETLKRERGELEELKSKFQSTSQLTEDMTGDMTDEVTKVQKEIDIKKASKIVSTNVKEETENKERPVKKENSFPLSKERNVAKELVTLENEDDGMGQIRKAVKNGEEIVHPFEIAESLYKLGGYKSALDIYKLINKNSLEKDKKVWISYQIANCYRKQGLFDEAKEIFREMLNEFEGTYWAKQAQWYIRDIEWRSEVDEKIEKVIGK